MRNVVRKGINLKVTQIVQKLHPRDITPQNKAIATGSHKIPASMITTNLLSPKNTSRTKAKIIPVSKDKEIKHMSFCVTVS